MNLGKRVMSGFNAGRRAILGAVALCLFAATALICRGQAPEGETATFEIKPDALLIKQGSEILPVSLKSPQFVFEGMEPTTSVAPGMIRGKVDRWRPIEVDYPPFKLKNGRTLHCQVRIQWSAKESLVRKWAIFSLDKPTSGTAAPLLLKEVILDKIGTEGRKMELLGDKPASYPAFMESFFAGIEFPMATTRMEAGQLILAHAPGKTIVPGEQYESRRVVYGYAEKGQTRRAFLRYISSHRPEPKGMHINYNSWWTSPVPYTEKDILGLMQTFEDKLAKPHGAQFDSYCIDMGWSDPKTFWGIDEKRFPKGFKTIQAAIERSGGHLGLWISPSGFYSPQSIDTDWAKANGYDTFTIPWVNNLPTRLICLGGKRSQPAFEKALVGITSNSQLRHIKFDGIWLKCDEKDHGHQPGDLSSEAMAEGIISVFQKVREASPQIWLEPTCFGYNASPWWLFYVNSMTGVFGDDAPWGRVPSPVHRESYTTARDFYNLQGAYWIKPIPIQAQEVLGLVHQSPEAFMNDAVMVALRGHMFMPVYLNPKFMNDARWKDVADFFKWSRKNAPLLQETEPILPAAWAMGDVPRFGHAASAPREPYGYAHFGGPEGLVALRNPWIEPANYALKLDGALGVPAGAKGLTVVSLYPEARVYGKNVKFGDTLRVPLAPYETVVLCFSEKPDAAADKLPQAAEALADAVKVGSKKAKVTRVKAGGAKEAASVIDFKGTVTVAAPEAKLLILTEHDHPTSATLGGTVEVDGKAVAPTIASASETGWGACMAPKPENWVFQSVPLAKGEHRLALKLASDRATSTSQLSLWIWATKPGAGEAAIYPNTLPRPELISLGSACLMETVNLAGGNGANEMPQGPQVYLDEIKPVSVAQGYGTLQKNRGMLEKPLTIGGKTYARGLGTHAPAKIVYNLKGQFKRFQAWVGADEATAPTVTFEVWADGKKLWESGLMERGMAAKRVDLDMTGVKTLVLANGDGGNNWVSDHADWAEAVLVR